VKTIKAEIEAKEQAARAVPEMPEDFHDAASAMWNTAWDLADTRWTTSRVSTSGASHARRSVERIGEHRKRTTNTARLLVVRSSQSPRKIFPITGEKPWNCLLLAKRSEAEVLPHPVSSICKTPRGSSSFQRENVAHRKVSIGVHCKLITRRSKRENFDRVPSKYSSAPCIVSPISWGKNQTR